jgi:lysophospholipase L1-like esterase
LWRIQNGELPKITQAKVLWVVIGTHDLGKTHLCSPELVVIGIVRVVEELLLQTSLQTNIVVQGMFPRTYNKDGYLAKSSTLGTGTLSLWQDIQVINEELKLYATYRTRVFYQRPPPLFDDDNLQLNKTLMEPDYLHLTNQGYQLWANQIVQRLKTMKRPTKKRSRYKQR